MFRDGKSHCFSPQPLDSSKKIQNLKAAKTKVPDKQRKSQTKLQEGGNTENKSRK